MNFLYDFYPEASIRAAGYQLVQFRYGDRLVRRPVIAPNDGRGLRIPMLAGREIIELTVAPAPPAFDPALREYYTERLRAKGAKLWDADLYCITQFGSGEGLVRLGIGNGRFLGYRLGVGLLREELDHARETGDWALPLRHQIAPDIATFVDFRTRLMGGGVHAFCAFRRPAPDDDYVILLQQRSGSVSEAQNTYGVVPMAFHQPPHPDCGPFDPRSPGLTALREVYEEIFGGAEDTEFLSHPAIAWLVERLDSICFELTALHISLVGGNYDFALALIVQDPAFWESFGHLLQHGWESREHLLVSSRDAARLGELLCSPNWEGQGLGTCTEGLIRLKELDPSRVADLPLLKV